MPGHHDVASSDDDDSGFGDSDVDNGDSDAVIDSAELLFSKYPDLEELRGAIMKLTVQLGLGAAQYRVQACSGGWRSSAWFAHFGETVRGDQSHTKYESMDNLLQITGRWVVQRTDRYKYKH